MRTIDETITLPFDVNKDDLNDIAFKLGVDIQVKNGAIIIEGDDAEVDEAAGMIAQLPKEKAKAESYENDPYESLEEGQRYTNQKDYLPDEYSVYDLLSFNEETGKWHCYMTTYHFRHAPYKVEFISHDTVDMSPAELIKLRQINRRK